MPNPEPFLRLAHIEIARFRRLRAVRLDLEPDTTVLVGANNSGKTSALVALRLFLQERTSFSVYDLSSEVWSDLNALGEQWANLSAEPASGGDTALPWADHLEKLRHAMPTVDLWLDARKGAFHHVSALIPSLSWAGGLVGVRLRLEPARDVKELQALAWRYHEARKDLHSLADNEPARARAWPRNLHDYWLRNPSALGQVVSYKLDPAKLVSPDKEGTAAPQALTADGHPLDGAPLRPLVCLHFIAAQRGLGGEEAEGRDGGEVRPLGLFSRQLLDFARRHRDLGPSLEQGHLKVRVAVAQAEEELDKAIEEALDEPSQSVKKLNYPGLRDPEKMTFRTRIQTANLLDHSTSVQYAVGEPGGQKVHLPEHAIGLGYQNLQAMSYRLAAFKADRLSMPHSGSIPPLHLVLVEEPEAHLHVQVQRVFLQKALELLRSEAPEHAHLSSQLVLSTHSSHLAHSDEFRRLRYFRRAPVQPATAPSSVVVTLADVFGDDAATRRFAERYLRVQHTDLLFADGAVFVEGSAEHMLVPFFVQRDFPRLHQRYLSYLEVGGSHAHRLSPLVRRLRLPTLVITDLDPMKPVTDPSGRTTMRSAAADDPDASASANATLKTWLPGTSELGRLLALAEADKDAPLAASGPERARVAYQVPGEAGCPCGSSFEDALILENVDFFASLPGTTPATRRVQALATEFGGSPRDLATKLHAALGDRFDKGAFAVDVLDAASEREADGGSLLKCPRYIREGLAWLDEQLSPSEAPP